jgi:hypothetical protein
VWLACHSLASASGCSCSVLLAVLPAFGLMLYTAWDHQRQARAAVQRDALHLAELAAADHQRVIEGARQLVMTLARESSASGPPRRVTRCWRTCERAIRGMPISWSPTRPGPSSAAPSRWPVP